MVVEAHGLKQEGRKATFTDERGRAVATIQHVVRVCWP